MSEGARGRAVARLRERIAVQVYESVSGFSADEPGSEDEWRGALGTATRITDALLSSGRADLLALLDADAPARTTAEARDVLADLIERSQGNDQPYPPADEIEDALWEAGYVIVGNNWRPPNATVEAWTDRAIAAEAQRDEADTLVEYLWERYHDLKHRDNGIHMSALPLPERALTDSLQRARVSVPETAETRKDEE